MTFESPVMLLGLLAIPIILWLHLRKRRVQVVMFPTVRLLHKVSKKNSPRLKFRSLFLLLFRILLVSAIVVAVSRPGLLVTRVGGIRAGMELAQVIVLDDSLSMRRQNESGGLAFDKALKIVLAEIGRLRPGDACVVVLSGKTARPLWDAVQFDLEALKNKVKTLKPGYRSGDIAGALRIAARLLEDSPLPQREVVLITDLSEVGWREQGLPFSDEEGIRFRTVGVTDSRQSSPNAAITSVNIATTGSGAREALVEAKVTNHGDKTLNKLSMILEIDGEEAARGSLDVPAGGIAAKRFHHRFSKEGAHRGLVRIGPDLLMEDNRRHFSVEVRKNIKVLIINGDYRLGSYKDEAFYLQKALKTPVVGESQIELLVVDVETAQTAPLTGHDVVFVLGTKSLSKPLAKRIADFAAAGGGVFIAPGNNSDKFTELAAVMPAKIRSVRKASRRKKQFRVGAANRRHPIFSSFGEGPLGLAESRIHAHLLVQPEHSFKRSVLVDLKDGMPLLLERKVGEGRVLLLTTTLDRDWTDLPIRPGFLPLMKRSVRYLAGRLNVKPPKRYKVGSSVTLEVSKGMKRIVVLNPNGKEFTFPAVQLDGKSQVKFHNTDLPGSYRVWVEVPSFGGIREAVASEFVVEVDPAESNLAIVDKEDKIELAALNKKERGKLPLWPYLLVAVIVFLLMETFFAGMWLKRSHLPRQ